MKASFLLFVTTAAVFLSGCDITTEPVPAYARISQPLADQTIYLGEPFNLEAIVEADAPVDSIVVSLQPKMTGALALRLPVSVPMRMRERIHPGNLIGVLDTVLVVEHRPEESIADHYLMILTYTREGEMGRSPSIPLRLERRVAEQN